MEWSTLDFITFFRRISMFVGSMDNFIYDYFIQPLWNHEGYNIVNTVVYAAIALLAVYILYRILKGRVRFDEGFIRSVLCFVLLGSTMRVITDAIDSGVFQPVTPIHQLVLDSGIWEYGYLTVTPGIYVVVAALLLVSMAVLYKMKRMELLGYVALVLWLPQFLLLLPFMSYILYSLPILILAAVPAYLAMKYFKDPVLAAIVAGQALDGAATFFIIDVFSAITGKAYFEQHVLSSAIGAIAGTYFAFYLLKVGIAFAAAYVLQKEDMDKDDRNYVALLLMIMGFAPGLRDVLRMILGA
jgi:uncharacterized membrane protein